MGRDIYEQQILEHYKNPRNEGKPEDLESYNVVELENTSCGDTITLYLRTDEEKIQNVRYEVEGCAISTASASLLSEYLINEESSIISDIDQEMMTEEIIQVDVSPMRLKCVLLPRDAIQEAIQSTDEE